MGCSNPDLSPDQKGIASRDSSAKIENSVATHVPWLIGGAADLAPSTKTRLTFEGSGDFEAEQYAGRNFHFGVREHAMGAICNGLALSKIRPFGSGFLIFSDYMRAAIRLSALMEVPVIYIFTHDSIGVGEDGPTHQPVEQLASLRAIPGLLTLRPCDAQRGRGSVAVHHATSASASLLGAVAAAAAHTRPQPACVGKWAGARAVSSVRMVKELQRRSKRIHQQAGRSSNRENG